MFSVRSLTDKKREEQQEQQQQQQQQQRRNKHKLRQKTKHSKERQQTNKPSPFLLQRKCRKILPPPLQIAQIMLLVLATSYTLDFIRRNNKNYLDGKGDQYSHLRADVHESKRKRVQVVREDAIQRSRWGSSSSSGGVGIGDEVGGGVGEEVEEEENAEEIMSRLQETLRARLQSKQQEDQNNLAGLSRKQALTIRTVDDLVKMKQQQQQQQPPPPPPPPPPPLLSPLPLQTESIPSISTTTTTSTIVLPNILNENLVNLPPPQSSSNANVIPLFWHVAKSGGTTVQELCSRCFKLVRASGSTSETKQKLEEENESLKIVTIDNEINLVNVDMATIEGIERAKNLKLIPSSLANVITTPYLYESSALFDSYEQKGQMFAVFRHPIERAVSMFHYLQHATWEPTYSPDLKDLTIEDYAMSDYVEQDWMVRTLTNKMADMTIPLADQDLELAKEILRTKCIVGLTAQMEQSIERFIQVFGWNKQEGGNQPQNGQEVVNVEACTKELLQSGGANKFDHPTEVEGSMAWELLKLKNVWDMQLYEYVVRLFEEQAVLFQ